MLRLVFELLSEVAELRRGPLLVDVPTPARLPEPPRTTPDPIVPFLPGRDALEGLYVPLLPPFAGRRPELMVPAVL